MAVQHGYGKIAGADALVFAYDTGDTRNSYKGEPTENLVNTNDNVYTLGNTNFPIAPPIKEVFNGSTQNGMNWTDHLRWYNETIPSGTTITISGWYMVYNTNASTPWNSSARLIIYSSAGYGGTVCNPDAWNTWKYFETTYTFPQDTTSFRLEDAGYDHYHTEDAANTTAYGCNYQVELKSHATSFVNGSRSATEGLLDLTGNHEVNLVNGGFDSNSEITFDGTDDKIITNYAPRFADFTVCIVFKDEGSNSWGRVVDKGYQTGFFISSYFASYGINHIGCGIIEPSSPHGIALPYDPSGYHFFTSVREGSTQRIYLDGIEQTDTKEVSPELLNAETIAFGRWNAASNSQNFNGKLPIVNVYDRALTPVEIQNNFNRYKTRFNIA